ncbi:hypothetical protein [Acetobacter peroxydans]|uniref:hypothetical protein n=1 Tax=Acetobacter peroxydans TaxID=104098 RepID=UPI002354C20A|nr:hypothetical protein [Acetobacter peroxydans]MCH4143141.1 hypothetical protein [Acetobacter peroxydans]MCI1393994.1 hypothetical protein [Acetobacter peroxydans]MCI1411608.1 hypothetical protein [Acetobacter peroxydans]MCI1440142.1 hypothetical protein [Acetobacter peroxydans]MCI1566926.1 hypothetical protein [Acetobacter peroxydans]
MTPAISEADRSQTFGPVKGFLAWRIASDDAYGFVFARDKCQGGTLVGIRHDVS